MSEPLLQITGVTAGFGPTTVLHGVDLTVAEGTVAGVFGLNGAGKSVLMKVVAGLVSARSGTITLAGRDITRASAEARVRAGMAHVPQGRQVFAELTVEENLRLGGYALRRRDRTAAASALDEVYSSFPLLAQRRRQTAGTMSGGQQAALSVARALVARPRLVCIDEPSAGLAPSVAQDLLASLAVLRGSGVTMLLVEQNLAFGLRLADTATVLQTGEVVHSGPVAELDPDVLARLLGVGRLVSGQVKGALTRGRTRARRPRTTARAGRG
jgi:branched-chain amino acid transport system ATP-binding protein